MLRVTKIPINRPEQGHAAKLRVAAYCRVSTDHEDQLVSLETQKQHYIQYIQSNPLWEYVGIYIDEGITGTKKEKRTGLLELLSDSENRKINFIVTKSVSRFARNTTDCLEIVRRLTNLGVHIFFEKENINTGTMDGELTLTILSGLAEIESVSNSQNYKWSIQRRFQNGTFKLSYSPYGYDCDDGRLVVNSEQAEVVRRVYREALSGHGVQRIAANLNNDGIPPKRGIYWDHSSVWEILRNEKYVGDNLLQKTFSDERFYRHNNHGERTQYLIQDDHEAIIRRDDFDAVATLLERHGKERGMGGGRRDHSPHYPFSGKILCGECGGKFIRRGTGQAKQRHVTWCCSRHIEDISKCSMYPIREGVIERAFVVMMNKLIFGHSFILKPLRQALMRSDQTENQLQILKLGEKIEENKERGRVLVGLMTKGYLEPAFFISQNNVLLSEATGLKEKRAALSKTIDGDTALSQVELLLKFTSAAASPIESFDSRLFDSFVDSILAYSPTEVGFKMKCGITLRERVEY